MYTCVALFAGLLLVLAIMAAGCSRTVNSPDEVRLALGYIPNVQFAPYYVASSDGYFEAEGLRVTIEYVSDLDTLKMVSNGRFDFAVTDGDSVVLGRLQGLPIRYVVTQYTQYPVGLISLKSAGIRSLVDLKGKRIGIPEFFGSSFIGLKALMFAAGLDESDFQIQAIGFTQVASLSEGRSDAVMGYLANEPVQLEAEGVPVDVIPVARVADLVGPGLVTSEGMLSSRGPLARRFVRGVLRGLEKTISDPQHAFEAARKFIPDLEGERNLRVQREVLAKALDMWRTVGPAGGNDPSRWQRTQELLLKAGIIDRILPPTDFFSNELLPPRQ